MPRTRAETTRTQPRADTTQPTVAPRQRQPAASPPPAAAPPAFKPRTAPAKQAKTDSFAPSKSNDKITFVAMNNSDAHRSTRESDALKSRGVNVSVVKDAPVNDTIGTRSASGGTTTHNLADQAGADAFVKTLGLPPEQSAKIAKVLVNADKDARDELGQIAQQWAVAEKGGQAPSRLVMSGHHVGYGVYGENNGHLEWPTVGALAEAMPRGARSVEDLLIAGCYSGGQSAMEQYVGIFPDAKTIVAYSGSSPGADSGAIPHQKLWEKATRGASQSIRPQLFAGTRKGENVTVWTKEHGFDDGKPAASLASLKQSYESREPGFRSALDGTTSIPDTQSGPVRDFYNSTQRLIQHPETTPAERKTLEATRDQTIRLIFYGPVSSKFHEVNGAKVASGFTALGLPAPNFKTLDRKQALRAISEFQTKLSATPDAPAAAAGIADLVRDFGDLKASVIPETWI